MTDVNLYRYTIRKTFGWAIVMVSSAGDWRAERNRLAERQAAKKGAA